MIVHSPTHSKIKLGDYNFQAQILSLLIKDASFFMDITPYLSDTHFDPPLDVLFRTIMKLSLNGMDITPTTISNELSITAQREGWDNDYLKEVVSHFKYIVNLTPENPTYIRERVLSILKEEAFKDLLFRVPHYVKEENYLGLIKEIERIASIGSVTDRTWSLSDASKVREELKKRYSPTVLATSGFPSFDAVLYGGFAPGELHLFQAPPKSGKSSLGVNIGISNLIFGKKVLHVTLELTGEEILMRYLVRATNKTYDEILKMPDDQWQELKSQIEKQFLENNLYIIYFPEGTATVMDIKRFLIRQLSTVNWKPDIIIVDYDDCLVPSTGKKESLYENSGDIYQDLIQLGVQFQCPIVTFAQPVREAWEKPERDEPILPQDVSHSARKIHRAWSITSMNFKSGSDKGFLYLGFNRRGRSAVRIPLKRNLEYMFIGEDS